MSKTKKSEEKAGDKVLQTNVNKIKQQDLLAVLDAEIEQNTLVGHHIDSFNSFISTGINQIVTQLFEIEKTIQNQREKTPEDQEIAFINFRAKFTDVRVSRPIVQMHKSGKSNALMPNMARKNDLNYSALVSMDATITAKAFLKDGGEPRVRTEEVKGFSVSLPIMKGSQVCHTVDLPYEARRNIEEDPKDPGGYFIVRGGEWVISMIESRLFNSPHIFRNIGHEKEIARLEYISKPGDAYENSSELIMKYITNGAIYLIFTSHRDLKPLQIPFYIIFRLFGMITDKEIVDSIVYGYSTPENKDVVSDYMLQILRRAFHISDPVFGEALHMTDQSKLIEYVSSRIAYISAQKSGHDIDENQMKWLSANLLHMLDKHVFPHIGLSAGSRHKKCRFLGHLCHKMLLVEMQIVQSTDRDSLKNKRILAAGRSYAKAFKTHFNLQVVQMIRKKLMKDFKAMPFSQVPLAQTFKSAIHAPDLEKALIQAIATGSKDVTVRNRTLTNRIASEILHRKNQLNFISTMRVIRTPSTSASKQDQRADEMRRVQSSYPDKICPIQSSDTGETVGMVKQAALGVSLSDAGSSELLKDTLLTDKDIFPLERVFPWQIHKYNLVKILVNGDWIGCAFNAPQIIQRYTESRRGWRVEATSNWVRSGKSTIDPKTSINWDTDSNEINFWVDAGRMLHPALIVRNNSELDPIGQQLLRTKYDAIAGPPVTLDENGIPIIKPGSFIQDLVLTQEDIKALYKKTITISELHERGIIDYLSVEEMENTLIAPSLDNLKQNQTNPLLRFTHCEIPAGLLGVPALTCPFAQHNQIPRITFQTNQSKQTCGWYTLNWAYRVDKHAFLQYYCEIPIIKTIVSKYLYPNGMNEINAIACYSGYNQEDSLCVNMTSSERGLYKGNQISFTKVVLEPKEHFGNPNAATVMDISKHANYEHLVSGFIKKYTHVKKDDVLVGKYIELETPVDNYKFKDTSVTYHYAEEAMIEDVIHGRNQEGAEIVKVKYSSPRLADIGSKFCKLPSSQVLTTQGWVQMCDVTLDHEVACLINDQYLEYHKPTELHLFYHKGPMYHLESQQVRTICTPNHKLYVKPRYHLHFKGIEARHVMGKRVEFKKNAIYNKPRIELFECKYEDEFEVFEMDNFLFFLGIFISDGWISDKTIIISAKKQRKIDQLERVCEDLGLEIYYGSNPYKHKIKCCALLNFLKPLSVGAINKFLPDLVWNLNQEQAKILLNALISVDGYISNNGSESYCTSSKRLADDITRLALHAGWSATVHLHKEKGTLYYTKCKTSIINADASIIYIVKRKNTPTINDSSFGNSGKYYEEYIDYDDFVMCIEVPGHTFYAREDDHSPPFWDSNSSRSGQKGMISISFDQSNMLFTENGLLVDKILSPMAIPSRMTIAQLIESQIGNLMAHRGSLGDGTIFSVYDDPNIVGDELEKEGFDRYGTHRCYNGMTGEWIDALIFIGCVYYQRLQKFVIDEVYSISTGPSCMISRQPLEGKNQNGGLRIGEMEKDVCVALGIGHFLLEKFRDDSDGFNVFICRTCGKYLAVNLDKNIIVCNTCKSAGLDGVPVQVKSTWSSKLFIQELQSTNIGVYQKIEPYAYEVFD